MFLNDLMNRMAEWDLTWVANHLWQATVFTMLAFSVTLLLSRARAQTRYLVWLVASVKFALPSALVALFVERIGHYTALTQDALPAQVGKVYVASEVAQPLLEPFGAVNAEASTQLGGLNGLLIFIWSIGFVSLITRWIWRRRILYRVIAGAPPVRDGRAWEILSRLKRQLDVRGHVELKISTAIPEPGVWGVQRSVLVLPQGLADVLDDAELEALLMHELLHVRRRDNLIGTLQMLVCCLFWFHPLVWLIDRRLLAERERACDEAVIEFSGANSVYLSGILKVLRFCLHSRVAGASGASGSNLQRRIAYIMDGKAKITSAVWHRLIVGSIVGAAALVSLTNAFARGDGFKVGTQSATLAQKSGAASALTDETQPPARPTPRFETIKMIEHPAQPDVITGEIELPPPPPASGELLEVVLMPSQQQQAANAQTEFPEIAVRFDNNDESLIVINSVSMKIVTAEEFSKLFNGASVVNEQYATLPTVSFVNTSPRKIKEIGLSFAKPGSGRTILGKRVAIEPGEAFTFRGVGGGLNAALPGDGSDVLVKVAWVTWEDGTQWGGGMPKPPRPPVPPRPPLPPSPDEPPPPSVLPSTPRGYGAPIK